MIFTVVYLSFLFSILLGFTLYRIYYSLISCLGIIVERIDWCRIGRRIQSDSIVE